VATPALVTIRSSATVSLGGAIYSVPSAWARRDATAYVGVDHVRIQCDGQEVIRPRVRRGARLIRYRDYLPELARKPQALRQVAGDLLQELGEPYATLWRLLVDAHGPQEAARVLAKLLAIMSASGETAVSALLRKVMAAEIKADALPLPAPAHVQVPETLAQYHVESGSARDYDFLLMEAANA
jgi:hypothetical protein